MFWFGHTPVGHLGLSVGCLGFSCGRLGVAVGYLGSFEILVELAHLGNCVVWTVVVDRSFCRFKVDLSCLAV